MAPAGDFNLRPVGLRVCSTFDHRGVAVVDADDVCVVARGLCPLQKEASRSRNRLGSNPFPAAPRLVDEPQCSMLLRPRAPGICPD
jgi:hypothetical protein